MPIDAVWFWELPESNTCRSAPTSLGRPFLFFSSSVSHLQHGNPSLSVTCFDSPLGCLFYRSLASWMPLCSILLFSENIFPACHSSLYFHCSFFETLLSTCFALDPRGPLRIPSSFLQPGLLCSPFSGLVYGFPFSLCFILNNVIHFLFVCEAPWLKGWLPSSWALKQVGDRHLCV